MAKWSIGAIEIFPLVEVEAGALIQSIIENASPENIRKIPCLCPDFADTNGKFKAVVQCFLIHDDNKWILVDACNGNDKSRSDMPIWSHLRTDFIDNLRAIGITEADINFVICTHLHCDHVGWLTRLENGRWIPTFPNAKHIVVRNEFEYWKTKPAAYAPGFEP